MSEAEAVIVTGSDEASISSSFQILKFKMEAGDRRAQGWPD